MNLSPFIDHSVLKPDATRNEIAAGAKVCIEYHFPVYCVNSVHTAAAVSDLRGLDVRVAATVAFPFGAVESTVKADEAYRAVRAGAREVDMVVDIGALKDHNWNRAMDDLRTVVEAIRGITLKAIIETGYLTRDEIRDAILCVVESGAAYVKNSTGFGPRGADLEELAWIRKITPQSIGVKAAGGIRTYAQAVALVEHGIQRIGTSVGPALLTPSVSA